MAELSQALMTPSPIMVEGGMMDPPQVSAMDDAADQFGRVAAAITRLADTYVDQPSLEDLAAEAGMHPHHFQRVFKRWAGVSPKRFAQFLTVEHAKDLLRQSASVLDAALDVGLSGPSRLHDLFVACEAMTPGEYKAAGQDLIIRYGVHDTRFGPAVVAVTDRGICFLGFLVAEDPLDPANWLVTTWGQATLVRDQAATAPAIAAAFDGVRPDGGVRLLVKGTNFQVKVWRALLSIPPGCVASYRQIAEAVCTSRAARAVGSACASNTIAMLIPCHRVIRSTGVIDGYNWSTPRKRTLIAWESAQHAAL